jgi:predicted ribosomally synthesized peptide with nif11-like leader
MACLAPEDVASNNQFSAKALGQNPADPLARHPLTLAALDAFLAFAKGEPALAERLGQPLELDELLALGRSHGFALEAEDVIAAQQREEASLSAAELQQRAGADARKLRSFIPG